jgi:S-DNA-T family DNA segregation ATPase FtsK/SpoIIIE
MPVGAPKPMRVQTSFISDSEIVDVVSDSMKKYGAPKFIDIPEYTTPKAARDDDFDDEEDAVKSLLSDEDFKEALYIAVRSGKIATSLLQRKLRIGYAKAAYFIDYMEEFGFISPPNGSKPREVLITEDELRAFIEDHE